MKKGHHNWRVIFADTVMFGLVFGLTNVISYLFLVVAGRNLLPAEFGVFNALLGLLTMTGAFAGSLQVAVTRAVSEHANRDTFASLMRATWRFSLPGTVLLTIVALPFASRIGANATQVVICGATLLAIILSSTALGFLVGSGKVRSQADLGFLGAVARLVAGWALMLAGFGVSGALAGYAANYLMVLTLAYAMSLHVSKRQEIPRNGISPVLRIEGSTVAIFVLAFAPFSLDQFMVQFFNPALGGDYAATATVAKLSFFAAYPITAIAYPNLLAQTDPRSRIRAIAAASAAIVLITGALALAIGAFPREVTQFFFGGRFGEAAHSLGLLALGLACFSLSTLGVHAQIAWGGRGGYLPSLAALTLALVLYAFRHDTLAVVVENQVWVYALQMVLIWGLLAATVARSRRHQSTAAPVPHAGL